MSAIAARKSDQARTRRRAQAAGDRPASAEPWGKADHRHRWMRSWSDILKQMIATCDKCGAIKYTEGRKT